ncbi:hypothetical protein AMS62_24785 [Bacillus sp. FJAT-18019]|uniref:Spore protein YkvP/CgeB glycosyl transferase-like domain-containing protein n=1 Tax=Paenibacillus solani TaxID=1705565 RepID=A0A0M1P5I1_9BACL|nr:glycosyltransferase [Paenibacillus solani]KOP68103.1 hypothetical protein AMS62_24785 [Bacillus sp. FJAT-18019]KOR89560.1 hypothetical protein AM231_10700 [Paenibacillus solani]
MGFEIQRIASSISPWRTEAAKELIRKFSPGKDWVTAGNKEEMQKTIKYYLNHPAERKAIQLQGQSTIKKHMYKYRAKEILQVLKREGVITADV